MIKAHSSFIQVRAGTGTKKDRVYVKGYASMPNKQDLWNFIKLPNGRTRTFKSLFTDSCVDDMRKQLMNKAVFVDGMHEMATNMGILNLAKKYNFDEEDLHNTEAYLKQKRLPLAKVTEFDIDDNGLCLSTETNPHFALADEEHQKYYAAITGSLLDGYLKGYSINFDPVEFKTETDSEGNELDVINKVNLYGVSYTDGPALPDNQFTEVCMRSLGNFMKVRTMTEKKEPIEKKEEAQPTPKNEKVDIENEVEKRVQEELKKKETATDMETVKKQLQEQKDIIDNLQKEREKLPGNTETKVEEGTQPKQEKSIVQPQDKYHQPMGNADTEQILKDGMEALGSLKKEYDDYMDLVNKPTSDGEAGTGPRKIYGKNINEVYGKMLELQREIQLHRQPMAGESQQDYLQRMSIINSNQADMSVKHVVRV